MNSEDELIQNYQVNESIWESTSSSASDKASAWRKQLLLLEHLSCNSDDATQYDLMKHHYDKWENYEDPSFLLDRVKNVKKLLNNFQNKKNCNYSNGFPDIDELSFEPLCHGEYESCAHNEITNEQLQLLKNDPIMIHKENLNKNINANSSTSMPSIGVTQAVQRNSMANFLHNTKQSKPPAQPNINGLNPNPIYTKVNIAANKTDNSSASANSANDVVSNEFRTAREELMIQNSKKYGSNNGSNHGAAQTPLFNYGQTKKSLGARRNVRSGFVPPIRSEDHVNGENILSNNCTANVASNFNNNVLGSIPNNQKGINPSPPIATQNSQTINQSPPLANIDPKMIELITNEIMHKYKPISWDDIAGLEYAKSIIKEAVVYPLLRPDIFTGLRRPPRGILLFGPPGTGKTLIGKCIASQSKSTFFSISASSLTSKWIGDGEKMVRALFAVAVVHQPSVVFIDEIDSLLSQRSESEHESSRRLKNEFLIQLDGAATSDDDRILIVGATNRPQELDEAARRRLVRRLYIPLPEHQARIQILNNLLQTVRNDLTNGEIEEIGRLTNGYSGADMDTLCREASMEPIRSIPAEEMAHFKEDNVRPVNIEDFRTALQNVRPSVSQDDLKQYLDWNRIYGAKR